MLFNSNCTGKFSILLFYPLEGYLLFRPYFTNHAYYFLGDRIPDAPALLQSPESLEPLIERLSEERSLSLSPSLPLSAGPSTAMFAVVVVVVFPLRSFIRRRHRLGTSINEIHKILASSDLLTCKLCVLTIWKFWIFLRADVIYGGTVYLFFLFSSPSSR